MKKILLFIFLSLIFCNSSFAEWKKFGNINGNKGKYYVDTDSIIKESGYLYFWKMNDYIEPIEPSKYYSVKVYIKGDCKIKRIKTLSYVFYTGNKGTGESEQQESQNKNWKYPTPENIDSVLLSKLC